MTGKAITLLPEHHWEIIHYLDIKTLFHYYCSSTNNSALVSYFIERNGIEYLTKWLNESYNETLLEAKFLNALTAYVKEPKTDNTFEFLQAFATTIKTQAESHIDAKKIMCYLTLIPDSIIIKNVTTLDVDLEFS